MALFFDNKQHLSEMKKIYLLEKRVDKIENVLEGQILAQAQSKEPSLLKEEILLEVSQKWEEISLKLFSPPDLSALKEEIIAQVTQANSPATPPDLSALKGEILAQLEGLQTSSPPTPPDLSALKGEILAQLTLPSSKESGQGKDLQKKITALEEKLENLQNSPSRSLKEEGPAGRGVLTPQAIPAPPAPPMEELHRQIRSQVQEALSTTQISTPAPTIDRATVEGWMESLLENQFLPEIGQILEKQARKIRRLEKKIGRMTMMLTNMDFDEDEDEFLELFASKKRKKKKRQFSPPQEERKPLNPAKNAALESLFNMNMDLQKNL